MKSLTDDQKEAFMLSLILRDRGKNNSLHDINRAADLLEKFSGINDHGRDSSA